VLKVAIVLVIAALNFGAFLVGLLLRRRRRRRLRRR